MSVSLNPTADTCSTDGKGEKDFEPIKYGDSDIKSDIKLPILKFGNVAGRAVDNNKVFDFKA